jgi:hypothetical protein
MIGKYVPLAIFLAGCLPEGVPFLEDRPMPSLESRLLTGERMVDYYEAGYLVRTDTNSCPEGEICLDYAGFPRETISEHYLFMETIFPSIPMEILEGLSICIADDEEIESICENQACFFRSNSAIYSRSTNVPYTLGLGHHEAGHAFREGKEYSSIAHEFMAAFGGYQYSQQYAGFLFLNLCQEVQDVEGGSDKMLEYDYAAILFLHNLIENGYDFNVTFQHILDASVEDLDAEVSAILLEHEGESNAWIYYGLWQQLSDDPQMVNEIVRYGYVTINEANELLDFLQIYSGLKNVAVTMDPYRMELITAGQEKFLATPEYTNRAFKHMFGE